MREELERRPMVIAFLALVIGSASFISPVNFIFLVPLVYVIKRKLIPIICCLLGWCLYPRLDEKVVSDEGFLEGKVDVLTMPVLTGTSRRAVVSRGGSRYLIYLESGSNIALGDRISVRAEVLPLREGQYAQRGAIGVLRTLEEPIVIDQGSLLWRAGNWVSKSFAKFTSQFLTPSTAAMLDAMCFNMTADVDETFMDAMSKTGTVHIISTSGLHLVLVAYALTLSLSRLPIPRAWLLFILFGLLMVYAAASGFRPPVVRAVIMTIVFLTAYLWRRSPDGLSALSLAGFLSLLVAPELVADIGFQLSVVAVGSLVLFGSVQVTEHAHPLARLGINYAWASLVVSLATAPLIAYHFGQMSLVSVPANMLILPVLSLVIGGALASWLFWLMVPAMGILLLRSIIEPLTGWVGATIEGIASIPFASVAVSDFSPYWIVIAYLLAILAWRPVVKTA